MIATPRVTLMGGSFAPTARASPVLTIPAVRPLHIAICDGSLPEILRVRLLSIPQHRQAAAIRSAPPEMARPPSCGSERRMPPRRMSAKPAPTRLSTFSRKMTHAMDAVATASRLRSRDAVLACVLNSPNRRSAGPATPPTRVAPASQGRSARESGVSVRLVRRSGANCSRNCEADPRAEIEQTSNEQWVGRRDSELRKRCACAKKQRRAKCAQDTAMSIRSAVVGHRVFGFTVALPAGVVEAGRVRRSRSRLLRHA